MKKLRFFTACAIIFSLTSCEKKNELQERIDEINEGLYFILGSKPKEIYEKLGVYGGTGTITCDDATQAGFKYKEKRSDGVDVYTFGVKNGLETEFYYRNDAAVGFKTRDSEFGFSYFGYMIGCPIWSHRGEYSCLSDAFHQKGFETDVVSEKREEEIWNGMIRRYAWYSATFENKLHVDFSWDEIYTLNGNIRTMEVFIDA